MSQEHLIPHLFRTEYSKIVAVLCKSFNLSHIEVAEDIASETFLKASESWGMSGVPENPTAWLYTVAKNAAKQYLKRSNIFEQKISGEIKNTESERQRSAEVSDIDLSNENIADSQLKMIFALCHPNIPIESQIGLSLRILCGFGIEEIAQAFLTNKETINKRLHRSKARLKEIGVNMEMPSDEQIQDRLSGVLRTLYLLFNEGYSSQSKNLLIRKDFCLEAMRLTLLLTTTKLTNQPTVNALLALMCFHASRFDARISKEGEMILYEDQDEHLWDRELMQKGEYYLNLSASGNSVSKYHLEAAIGYWHTQKEDTSQKWEKILQLYNQLLQINYSPIIALNRTYALAKVNGPSQAVAEAKKLKLESNPYYHILLAELYLQLNSPETIPCLQTALKLIRSETEKIVVSKKLTLAKRKLGIQ